MPPVVRDHHVVQVVEQRGVKINIKVGTLVDGLTAMMLVMVSIISLLVHIYSKEYLKGDIRFTHYYAFLSLFTGSMLFYVMGATTLQMLVGWELVGVCSFVLIGHWWEEKTEQRRGSEGVLDQPRGRRRPAARRDRLVLRRRARPSTCSTSTATRLTPGANQTLLLVGALLLFGGVTSKSGQFPLHTWLPDAMAGPDAGVGTHPRRHDGRRRRLPDRPACTPSSSRA